MVIADRLRQRMQKRGMSQSEMARRLGVTQGTIAHLVNGRTTNSVHLPAIAAALDTTVAYLNGDTDNPTEGAPIPMSKEDMAEELGLIELEEIDLALGMGSTFLEETPVNSVSKWIPEDWVRQFTNSPAGCLTIARPRGDSMYPTINDRDIIIIDRSRRSIDEQEGIWALFYGGLGTIKRVRALPDGSFKLMADNQQVSDEMAVDGEMSVFGRVVGVIRRT